MSAASQDTVEVTFPPIDVSPYRIEKTSRRERWWFADGLWLNQGQEEAVVGFAWTQWLGDRGIEIRDGVLGEEYARELQRAAQLAGGTPVGPGRGAQMAAGAAVLIERGLLEACYACPDVDSMVSVVLERGPVLTGLRFSSEVFNQPDEVDGWIVCRLGKGHDSTLKFCVSVDGAALDLTIGGVTGFVRFKLCWGTSWGDGGHALLSIDDLRQLFAAETPALLPIPAAGALRSGLRPDVADEAQPYRPRQIRYEQTGIDSDAWTRRDTLGAAAYAEAIARGIQHPETKPPLTIGIKGAWGAGKTSLMRMVRDRLEWPERDGSSDTLRQIHLTRVSAKRLAASPASVDGAQDLPEVTAGVVLRKLRSADAGRDSSAAADEPELQAALGPAGQKRPMPAEDRWRPTVWFNPWMYQTGEQVWAGLAHQIIEQVAGRMTHAERENFWLHLNLRRVDGEVVRRRVYGVLVGRVLPFVVVGLVVLAAGIAILLSGGSEPSGSALAALGSLALLGGGVNTVAGLRSKLGSGLSALTKPVVDTASGEALFGGLVRSPDYQSRAGSLYLVHTDIKHVINLVATPKRPLVIFVDDLDRCSPGTVVQVIEAINLFVAGEYTNSIFVIAMEPEMVAAHVEAAYGDLVQRLEKAAGPTVQAFDLGWRFLEKIVQLPLALPAMDKSQTSTFVESLFPARVAEPISTGSDIQGRGGEPTGAHLGEEPAASAAIGMAGGVGPDAPSKEQLRRAIDRRLAMDDPVVQDAIRYACAHLHRNPREIKRFVNVFRFFTMIHAERKLAELPTTESLHEVAKLAVLAVRWPGLLGPLATPVEGEDDSTIYELLESSPARGGDGEVANDDAAIKAALTSTGLGEGTVDRLMAAEVREFLSSEPKVGSGVRGYL